ncbi:class I SAM-dependent DNA methyltransferase [Dactylosporangium sp. NPDC051541]|uniref:class I SAM-dependent DNA methyltransferase n=1 Tax=Dactylosporangium sp. NPDC051541 TaxID=3363977 RepID=UPI00379441BE
MTTTSSPGTFYGRGFAEFYDRYGTGWTRDFAPLLAQWLSGRPGAEERLVLDLACGTGVSAQILLRAGWDVIGLDISAGMLANAAHRLAQDVETGRVVLQQAEMTTFVLDRQVRACVALEGALNHLLSEEALEQCFARVAAVLPVGGTFVFDLYEPHHFRGWHNIGVTDEPDAVIVKRGVWDEERGIGMLRFSGLFDDGSGPIRVDQTVTSRAYGADVLNALLSKAGLDPEPYPAEVPACACGRSRSGSCRTVYAATKAA